METREFDHAAGLNVHGARFDDADAIRVIFIELLVSVTPIHEETLDCRIVVDNAFSDLPERHTRSLLSIDILTYRDGLIVHKDAFYKQRTAQAVRVGQE